MNKELIEKAKGTKSAKELFALAKEEGIGLTEEQAKQYFDQLHSAEELSDDELDMIGGGCGGSDGDSDGYITVDNKKHRIIHDPTQKCVNGFFFPGKNTVGILLTDRPDTCENCAYIHSTDKNGTTVYYCYTVS